MPTPQVHDSDCRLVDDGGRPLAHWTVEAEYEDFGRYRSHRPIVMSAVTDDSGRFPVFGIAAVARVVVYPPGANGRIRRAVQPGSISLSTRGVELTPVRGTRITGRIVGAPTGPTLVDRVRATIRHHAERARAIRN